MSSKLDLLTLDLFVAVVEDGSLAKAAERKNIAISAVSRRIAELEESFNVRLLNRLRNGVEPTAAGYAMLGHARSVLRDARRLEAELLGYASGNFGLVRIFASESAVFSAVPEALKSFLDMHPMVRIELEEATSPAVVRAVIENRADLGLYVGEQAISGIERFRFHTDRLTVLVPADHRLAHRERVLFEELLDDEFICQQVDSSTEQLTQAAARQMGRSFKSRIRVTGFDTACRMVEAGLGIAIAAERITAKLAPVMHLRQLELSEDWAIRPHYVCARKATALAAAARHLIEHLASGAYEPDLPVSTPRHHQQEDEETESTNGMIWKQGQARPYHRADAHRKVRRGLQHNIEKPDE